MSDVTFLVEGKEIHANRAILAVRSEYFKVMLFSSCMKESLQANNYVANGVPVEERHPINIKDVSYAIFIKVLEFLYTDVVQVISMFFIIIFLKNTTNKLTITIFYSKGRFVGNRNPTANRE